MSRSRKADIPLPSLGTGVGLRAPHYGHILETRPKIPWFEAITENYMGIEGGAGARPLRILEDVRAHYPVVLHGVSLSIGSADPLDRNYLAGLKALVARIEPSWISDHLCWTGVEGENLHDLLPLPYTEEAVRHVAERVQEVQDFLGTRILLENVSSYLTFRHSEMTEWEFLTEVMQRADCLCLLDINNIYVSSRNHGFATKAYLEGIPLSRVGQFHLAGHTDHGDHVVDTHDHPVCEAVWDLYARAVERFGPVSTLLEWDDQIPEFAVLEAELARARSIEEKIIEGDQFFAASSAAAALAQMDHHGSERGVFRVVP
jgi:uncharacterized protein (UPF0276 family)